MWSCETKPKGIEEDRKCLGCGRSMEGRQKHARWCSSTCRSKAVYGNSKSSGLATGITGAIGELIVAMHLMRLGWMVFRNVAPVGRVDIMAKKGDRIIELDVTTGYRNENGAISHCKKHATCGIAVVIQGEPEPIYIPEL